MKITVNKSQYRIVDGMRMPVILPSMPARLRKRLPRNDRWLWVRNLLGHDGFSF